MQVLISIGSNFEAQKNVPEAIRLLSQLLADVTVSRIITTRPFGEQYRDNFHNCLISGFTSLPIAALEQLLKHVEQRIGRTGGSKITGIVHVDLDILMYDGMKYHLNDWQRPYVLKLIDEVSD
ncbi:MAG: 2-amino-4-hydroxy-6-hydroxymethyldihydropteridine diphosphokinase [Prevotella sp.]|nr:2-amino-4-hydroxy-6-hydroxymethyldihydropteridine diphosphokinase [Prevotella sp.]MBO5204376.1 2-amino-4-hydroxy-6-hydroxymethyldihydropteridine diphosphokinase [Prevotella sp.]MDO5525423.1 2-amino-4-hydroxy-6-hydroxymethyldihydropteridine diphosphokinase [Prevotella sp.]